MGVSVKTADLQWIKADRLMAEVHVSCIDGRHECCTIGAPGGNAGEVVVLLTAAEWISGRSYASEDVADVVRTVVEIQGDFYMHTDEAALAKLAASVDQSPQTVRTWLLDGPPENRRAELLTAVVEPDHVGCGHLQQLLRDPHRYRTRGHLVRHVIRTFFELRWAGDQRLRLEILEGDHEESAVLVFHTPRSIGDDTPVPLGCGDDDGAS